MASLEWKRPFKPWMSHLPVSILRCRGEPHLLISTFKRAVCLERVERTTNSLQVTYTSEGFGTWTMQIEPERVLFERTWPVSAPCWICTASITL